MANTYELIVKTVDRSSRPLQNIEKSLRRVERQSRSLNLALKGVGAALIAVVSTRAISSVVRITGEFEDLRTTLNTVTGSARNGAQAFNFVSRFATRTAFTTAQLTNTYIKLAGAGIQPTERLLTTFSDTAAVTTDRLGTLEAITDLFARTTAGGLGLEDLNRLADRGIPVFDILSEKLGLARTAVAEFGQSAEGAAEIKDALVAGLNERFGGATESTLNNLTVLVSNLGEAVKVAIGQFGEGLSPALKEVTAGLTEFINGNQGFFRTLGELAGDALRGIAGGIRSVADTLGLVQPGGLQRVLASVLDGFATLAEGVTNSIQALLNAIGGSANLIQTAVRTLITVANALPGIDLNVEFGQQGETRADVFNRIVQSRVSAEVAAQDAIDALLLSRQQSRLREMQSQERQMLLIIDRLRMNLQFEFPGVDINSMLLQDQNFRELLTPLLNLQDDIAEQQRFVNSMIEQNGFMSQRIINAANEQLQAEIAAGNLMIVTEMGIGDMNIAEASAGTIETLRQYANQLREEAANAQDAMNELGMTYGTPLIIPSGGVGALLPPTTMTTGTPLEIPAGGVEALLPPVLPGRGGGSAPETAASLYRQAMEAINGTGQSARATAGALRMLEDSFASGNITLEQLRVGMESIGADMDMLSNQSIAMGMNISDAFVSAGDNLARGLARGIARGENIMDSFKNFMQSILEEILYQIIQQAFISPLISSMTQGLGAAFGAFSAGGASAFGGGLFGGGGGFLGGLFGIGRMFLGFADGGVVPGQVTQGDSIPALLTPGEVILNKRQQADFASMGNSEPITVNFNINAIDTRSGTEFILQNKKQITGVIQQAYNTRGQQGPLG